MEFEKGEIISFEKAQIKVIGLARLGRRPGERIDGPGSLSIPSHQIPGVYAGVASHGPKGNKLSQTIPVIIYCHPTDHRLNIQTNNILGKFIASVPYSEVTVLAA